MDSPFWINDPLILINKNQLTDFWPSESMSRNQKLNAISRTVIVLTLIGLLITQTFKIVITGLVTLAIIVILYLIQNNGPVATSSKLENFANLNMLNNNFTSPSKTNPMMNVVLTDYKDNPEKLEAAPAFYKPVEEDINETTKDFIAGQFGGNIEETQKVRDKLFCDLGDNFVFNQSMRNFYATPATTIPNDQTAFADYCYGDMISCKEQDPIACSRHNPRWTN
jgi:hypothetical protein